MQKLSTSLIIAIACLSKNTNQLGVNQLQGTDNFIPASDPNLWYTGRFLTNQDGSRSFDWEGAQMHLNVQGATYVKASINATGGIIGRFIVEVDGWEVSSFYASDDTDTNEFILAEGLSVADTHHVRLIQIIEPSYSGTPYHSNPFVFLGFSTDGVAIEPTPRSRRIELIGDSISAGFGSRGSASTEGCPVNIITSGNYYTYNWKIAEYFQADLVPIAWSGKGMYMNCCDDGETMPSYYQQTLARQAYVFDWDFSYYKPDMLLINLGTNDMNKYTGTSWGDKFVETYVEFVQTATARYAQPSMPVFVGQGNMNNSVLLQNLLLQVVSQVNSAGGNAYYLDMRVDPVDGCGSHPGVEGNQAMFEAAKPLIQQVMGW